MKPSFANDGTPDISIFHRTSLFVLLPSSEHHSWPLKQSEEYQKFRELAGPKGESSIIVSLCIEWTKKQQIIEEQQGTSTEVLKNIAISGLAIYGGVEALRRILGWIEDSP